MLWGALLVGVIAVIAGAGMGVILGSANSDSFETVVRTVGGKTRTVTEVEKRTVTETKTVTEAEEFDEPVAGRAAAGDDDADEDGCSDSYQGPCLDPADGSKDVDCTEIGQQDFNSIRDDPYGLDPNGDSIACESY